MVVDATKYACMEDETLLHLEVYERICLYTCILVDHILNAMWLNRMQLSQEDCFAHRHLASQLAHTNMDDCLCVCLHHLYCCQSCRHFCGLLSLW